MTDYGRTKIEEAKQNNQWNIENPADFTERQIKLLVAVLKEEKVAYSNFIAMSPSVQKNYARAYLDAKTDSGRTKRLAWMIDRINKNLKPM